MIWISVVFLAVAVSFDALAIGITYSLNRITIPFLSKIVLSLISGSVFFITMFLGTLLEQRLNPRITNQLGALVFICLGIYNLWRNYRITKEDTMLINWRIPVLGLIIQVFQEPLSADTDHSKDITGFEALILGGALALDSVAAGFGAATFNLPLLFTTVAVMATSFVFLSQGLKAGFRIADSAEPYGKWRWLPGVIILVLGIFKFFSSGA